MTTPRYVTVETLKDYVRSELSLQDDAYEAAINTAENILDNACHRRFEVVADDAVASARSFRSSGTRDLYINDCTEIVSIVDNGTEVADTTYWAEPLNGLSATGEAWPYYRLSHHFGWWYPTYPTEMVVVTAKWGWPAIPAQIVESCKIIAKDVAAQRDIRFGLVAVSEAGGVGTRENRIVRDAISTYMHPNAAVSMLS